MDVIQSSIIADHSGLQQFFFSNSIGYAYVTDEFGEEWVEVYADFDPSLIDQFLI